MISYVTNREKATLYVGLRPASGIVTDAQTFIVLAKYHFDADYVTGESKRMYLNPVESRPPAILLSDSGSS